MAGIIKIEHGWGQAPAYSERVVHALPKSWQFAAFKVQKFLDQSGSLCVAGVWVGSGICALRFSRLTVTFFEGILTALYIGCYPSLLKAKSEQFIRGSKADLVLVILGTSLAVAFCRSPYPIFAAQGFLLATLFCAEKKHKNPIVTTFETVCQCFEKMGRGDLATRLQNFKISNSEATPSRIVEEIIQTLHLLPDSTDSLHLQTLFAALEKYPEHISEKEKCVLQGTRTHTLLHERLRFINRSLYDAVTLSLCPPRTPVSNSAQELCIQWLKNPQVKPELVSPEQAFEVCLIANYIGASRLEKRCADFIRKQLTPENFFSYFENARKHCLASLFEEGLKYLLTDGKALLTDSESRLRLEALDTTYQIGCIAYLLKPNEYPHFKFIRSRRGVVLDVTKEEFNDPSWDLTEKLLKNLMIHDCPLRITLRLLNCQIPDLILAKMYQCEWIQALEFYHCTVAAGVYAAAPHLLRYSEANRVDLAPSIPRSATLREIRLRGNCDFGVILQNNPQVQVMEINNTFKLLHPEALTACSLKQLILANLCISNKEFAALCQTLEKNTTLEQLDLGNCFLDEAKFQSLVQLLEKNQTLKRLTITSFGDSEYKNRLTDDQLRQLKNFSRPGRTIYMEFSKQGIEQALAQPAGQLPNVMLPPPPPRVSETSKAKKMTALCLATLAAGSTAACVYAVKVKKIPFKILLKQKDILPYWILSCAAVSLLFVIAHDVRTASSKKSLVPPLPADNAYDEDVQKALLNYERVHAWVQAHENKLRGDWRVILQVAEKNVVQILARKEAHEPWLQEQLEVHAILCKAIKDYMGCVRDAVNDGRRKL